MVGLYSLHLDSNYLATVPDELGKLTGLTDLGLARNFLQYLRYAKYVKRDLYLCKETCIYVKRPETETKRSFSMAAEALSLSI